MARIFTLVVCTVCIGYATGLSAQIRTDQIYPGAEPRGPVEMTLCGQNLENYGQLKDFLARNPGSDPALYERKTEALAFRFANRDCDVIAVQEILGRSESLALGALENLAEAIRRKNNRYYQAVVGPTNDPNLRVGYLVALDRAEIQNKVSYYKVELPKITPEQKPRLFSRGPLELQLKVKPRVSSYAKMMTIINFHFKSQANGSKDASQSSWETYRMEMGEAVRRIVETRHLQSIKDGETLLALVGDRNSDRDTASAKILEGMVRLTHFQGNALCRLSKMAVPLCQVGIADPQLLFSVLTTDPQVGQLEGTFKYKKEYTWLDDILVPATTLKFARASFDSEGDYDSGVDYEPFWASDHAMTWVKFNW